MSFLGICSWQNMRFVLRVMRLMHLRIMSLQ
jgi:hypothetical protein